MLNISKTKEMTFSKKYRDYKIKIHSEIVEQGSQFKYLSAILDEQCKIEQEIYATIGQSRNDNLDTKNLFARSELSLNLRFRML